MKLKSIFAFGMAALMGAMVFTSCKKDEAATPAPTIKFAVGGATVTTADAVSGTAISYELRVNAAAKIKSITVFEGTGESNKVQTHTKTEGFIQDTMDLITYTVTPSATVNQVFVEVTDKNDQVSKATLTLNIATSTALATEKTGQIYHIQASTGNGAWDLVNDVKLMSAGAVTSKDMIQASTNTSGSAWVAGWNVGAGCGTTYVKAAAAFDYTAATVESATAAYAAGTSSASITGVVVGDIYIAKLRGGSDYAVVKITTVDPNDVTETSGSNKGVIKFSYKKK